MIRPQVLALLAVLAAAATAGCGGGGSTPGGPAQAHGAAIGAAAKPTAPPASNARQAVGSGRVALTLPHVLRGKSGAMRARNAAAVAAVRGPAYVNPGPQPNATSSANPNGYNILDVYVDDTLLANLDGNFPGNDHSMYIDPATGDGTQTLNIPLYSTTNNDIVAVEWDSTDTDILALGESQLNGAIAKGTVNNVALTMLMQAYYVGIVDLPNLTDPQIMLGQNYVLGYGCPLAPPSGTFGLYAADAELMFVPVAGYAGTGTPFLSTTSPPLSVSYLLSPSGTSRIAQGPSGIYYAEYDANCDGVQLTADVANPAYTIYQDVTQGYPFNYNGNYNYYDGFQYGTLNGPYQGIWNQYWIGGRLYGALSQLNLPTAGYHQLPFIYLFPSAG